MRICYRDGNLLRSSTTTRVEKVVADRGGEKKSKNAQKMSSQSESTSYESLLSFHTYHRKKLQSLKEIKDSTRWKKDRVR